MRNILLIIIQMTLFLATYLVACFTPALLIIGANIMLDPSTAWPCVAETWLGSHGVPYPDVLSPVIYGLAVFYPSIRFSTWVVFDKADPLFNALEVE